LSDITSGNIFITRNKNNNSRASISAKNREKFVSHSNVNLSPKGEFLPTFEGKTSPTQIYKPRKSKTKGRNSSWRQSGSFRISPFGFFSNETALSDEAAACLKIQNAYRNMIARCEMQMVKETMRPGEGLNSNRLSSAVELSWNDITCRFVRYLGDHFWEKENDITRVNVLIIETFLAHLIKARTHFLDSNGMQLGESKAHKANSIESLETANLTKE